MQAQSQHRASVENSYGLNQDAFVNLGDNLEAFKYQRGIKTPQQT